MCKRWTKSEKKKERERKEKRKRKKKHESQRCTTIIHRRDHRRSVLHRCTRSVWRADNGGDCSVDGFPCTVAPWHETFCACLSASPLNRRFRRFAPIRRLPDKSLASRFVFRALSSFPPPLLSLSHSPILLPPPVISSIFSAREQVMRRGNGGWKGGEGTMED